MYFDRDFQVGEYKINRLGNRALKSGTFGRNILKPFFHLHKTERYGFVAINITVVSNSNYWSAGNDKNRLLEMFLRIA
jgi:hypothetical protein